MGTQVMVYEDCIHGLWGLYTWSMGNVDVVYGNCVDVVYGDCRRGLWDCRRVLLRL